jgi:hypothetical protein
MFIQSAKNSPVGALVTQTRLKPYLDKLTLTVAPNNTLQMDFTALIFIKMRPSSILYIESDKIC